MASITLKPPGRRWTVHGGGKRRLVIGSIEKRAPTEADARLIMNALLLPIYRWRPFPGRHRSPRGTGEVPRCAGGASPRCNVGSFFQTKLKKWQALSQKRAEVPCGQRPAILVTGGGRGGELLLKWDRTRRKSTQPTMWQLALLILVLIVAGIALSIYLAS